MGSPQSVAFTSPLDTPPGLAPRSAITFRAPVIAAPDLPMFALGPILLRALEPTPGGVPVG